MNITSTKIEGLYTIEYKYFEDHRGQLMKPFNFDNYERVIPLNLNFKETWFTKSHKNVIRAMHLQVGEKACEKLVSVIQGRLIDVILDIRKESKTYGQFFEIELSAQNPTALYIPKGCAHGYKVLEDNTITLYMATEVNIPKDDVGIHWNSFGYNWNIEVPILSEKDKNLPRFNEI